MPDNTGEMKLFKAGPVHIVPRVDIGELLTVGTLIISLVVYFKNIESRITTLEVTQAITQQNTKEALMDIKGSLVRIENKIDRKADKSGP